MAVPKRRMSRSNTRSRRSQWKASLPAYSTCKRCKQAKLPHVVCPTCGTYAGREVIRQEVPEEMQGRSAGEAEE